MNVKLFMVMIKESMLRVYYTENTSFMAAVCVNVTLLRVDGYNVMVKTCGHFMNIWHAVRRDCVWADMCQVQAMYHLRTTVFGGMCARFKQCTISELCLGWCVPVSSNVPSQNCVWGDICQVQAAMYHLRTVFGVICAWFATAILTFNMFTRKLITNCGQRSVLFWSSILNRHMCWNDVAYVVMLNCVYILYTNVPTCICVSPFISLE